jgi:hypothetical protein
LRLQLNYRQVADLMNERAFMSTLPAFGAIDFLLTAKRDAASAKRFFRKVFGDPANVQPATVPTVSMRVLFVFIVPEPSP